MSKWDDDRYKKAYAATMEGLAPHQTMDRLTSFLYVLMRDHVPPGVVTEAVIDAYVGEGPFILSNGHLACYAEHLAHKLRGTDQLLEELEEEGVHVPNAFRERLQQRRGGSADEQANGAEEDSGADGSPVKEG